MKKSVATWWHTIDDTWTIEISSMASSSASLAILAGLLYRYDDHPIFDWHGLTLNAIVSILSTASKGWLLLAISEAVSQWKWITFSRMQHRLIRFEIIDRASRGPLGCLQLIASKGMSFGLRLGVLATVLALALDPFVQQLISVESSINYVSPSFNATVPAARRYSKGSLQSGETAGREHGIATGASCEFDIQSSVIFGLANTESLIQRQVPFECPSGNCNWQPFRSLAVCSACQSLTYQLGFKYTPPPPPAPVAFGAPVQYPGRVDASLPNGLTISNNSDTLMAMRVTSKFNESLQFSHNDRVFLSTIVINSTARLEWPAKPFTAHECVLYYCVREYQSRVTNGTLSENSTEVRSAKRSSQSWEPVFEAVFSSSMPVIWNLLPNDTLDFQPNAAISDRTDLTIGDGFNISYTAVTGISLYLQNIFLGHPANASEPETETVFVKGNTTAQVQLVYGQDTLRPIYRSADIGSTFSALARSMSNGIRAGGDLDDPTTAFAQGQIGHLESRYSIRWPWIVYPIAINILGYITLWTAFRKSRLDSIPLWKSCALAIMMRGQSVQEPLSGAHFASELHQKAAKVYTRLLDTSYQDLEDMSRQSSLKPQRAPLLME